jgi:hypothetical protein
MEPVDATPLPIPHELSSSLSIVSVIMSDIEPNCREFFMLPELPDATTFFRFAAGGFVGGLARLRGAGLLFKSGEFLTCSL